MVRTRNDASNTISSLICIFSMSFPGSRRCLTHHREMFLEHVHLTSPWADYIGIPLFRGVFYSPGSHSRALWKGERLEILRRREYCESEKPERGRVTRVKNTRELLRDRQRETDDPSFHFPRSSSFHRFSLSFIRRLKDNLVWKHLARVDNEIIANWKYLVNLFSRKSEKNFPRGE